jgi:hypothetical protein
MSGVLVGLSGLLGRRVVDSIKQSLLCKVQPSSSNDTPSTMRLPLTTISAIATLDDSCTLSHTQQIIPPRLPMELHVLGIGDGMHAWRSEELIRGRVLRCR